MKEVLQPLNEKAADIIVRHADLLQSAQMEPLLLQLVAHVSAYRVILKRCTQIFQAVCRGTVVEIQNVFPI
jgi:hypothetical protein